MTKTILAFLAFAALLICFVAPAYATPATFVFHGSTHVVNETFGYKLLTSNSTDEGYDGTGYSGSTSVSHAIRVYIVDSDGDETEVSNGTVQAVVTRSGSGAGIQSATWNCPSTNNAYSDALIVRIYRRFASDTWSLRVTFVTLPLNMKLSNSTWTIYYYTERSYNVGLGQTIGTFYWGTATYYSHITNVELESYTTWQWMDSYLKSGNFMRFVLAPYVNPLGELAFGMIVLIPSLAIYNRTENLSYVAVIFILFGGASGLLTMLIPAMGLNLANILLIVGVAVLFAKLILTLKNR